MAMVEEDMEDPFVNRQRSTSGKIRLHRHELAAKIASLIIGLCASDALLPT